MPELGRYVAENVAFPATMVDRIVPATTDADRARIAAATGLEDSWPVVTEAYNNWVVEDNFPQGRPAMGRDLRHRHQALRADEAAAAQWRAFLHGLSRLSRRA
jgi:mannitol-1-phosphate/altronate dehydrogenase